MTPGEAVASVDFFSTFFQWSFCLKAAAKTQRRNKGNASRGLCLSREKDLHPVLPMFGDNLV